MRVKFRFAFLLLLAALTSSAHAEPLRVAAAANLQKVFTEALLPAFARKTGVAVTPTFGATKALATQIENGAPIDVFVAADTATVQKLASERVIVAGTVHPYAIGRLVLWSSAQASHHPQRLQDLADPAYAKIAIANPKTAPYGLAAQQAFARAGIGPRVAPRVVQAENIGQALQFAQSRNADVCLTALSLVIEDKTDPYIIVPDTLHDPITQSLGLVRTTTQTTQGLQFIDFLTGKDAAKIWRRYGYELPGKKARRPRPARTRPGGRPSTTTLRRSRRTRPPLPTPAPRRVSSSPSSRALPSLNVLLTHRVRSGTR